MPHAGALRPEGPRRRHHAVELPARARHHGCRPRPRRGQRCRAESRRPGCADRSSPRGARSSMPGVPADALGVVAAPGPRSATPSSTTPIRLLHRLDRDRQDRRQRASRRLIGASLELGGKNPMIVLDDVDPKKAAADAAYGCFSAAGQLCVSMERIYVEKGVAEAFTAAFAGASRSLKSARPSTTRPTSDRSTTQAQLRARHRSHRRRRQEGRDRARGRQAPARPRPVLRRADSADQRHQRDGCFATRPSAPWSPCTVVDDADEAVALANDSSTDSTPRC